MQTNTVSIADAQRDMRYAYFGGAPGILASAIVWMVASGVAWSSSPKNAVLALFVGGMMIHPAGVLIAKILGRPGTHQKTNPMGSLALEGTVWLLLSLPLAFVISKSHVEWFFPAMLLVIGGRYLTFATLYGLRLYWACGAALAIAGILIVVLEVPFAVAALTGSVIEFVFAALIYKRARAERFD
jgi:hypothetical protein